MEFLTNNPEYTREYNKKEATRELKNHDRIAKVVCTSRTMTITTEPLMPRKVFYPELLISPVGRYIIKLTKMQDTLRLVVEREKGEIRDSYFHPHVEGGICWGDVESEMRVIRNNFDWYWTTMRCLDLLDDYNDDDGTFNEYEIFGFMINAQISNNPKIKPKLKKVAHKFLIENKEIMKGILYDIDDRDEYKQFIKDYSLKKYDTWDKEDYEEGGDTPNPYDVPIPNDTWIRA